MRSAEIRERFLRFFEDRGHVVVPSASLIAEDPTLLLVNAGMVPFKPYFVGERPAPYPRAASVQKCVRTVDIESVGRTARHVSFFQMAGNFSFGDYFKAGAIPYAWELSTAPVGRGGFGLEPDRIWATVYLDDDEAFELWTGEVGLPAERVQRRGKKDNYWSMGVPGPCGPCSELYYDRGPAYGPEGGPIVDEERYLEFWNLVFMQFERGPGEGYDYPILGELPAKNIDTGLGLDRLATIVQGVPNIYEADLLRPVLDRAGELTATRYGADPDKDVRLRVIADHVRTATMLIADGVTPSNEAAGYVLRRMLRRAIRNIRLLGRTDPVVGELVAVARDVMSPSYPVLSGNSRVVEVATAEEESFLGTLRTGMTLFDAAVREARHAGADRLSGERAFALHDTYGFPVDLTLEMAAEQGLSVDEDGFRRLMEEQRRRARLDAQARKTGHVDLSVYRELLEQAGPSAFTGYTEVRTEARLAAMLVDGAPVRSAEQEQLVELVLDRSPFYAEGGGQLADTGRIEVGEATLDVLDVQRPLPDLIVHRSRVLTGEVATGSVVTALVDVDRRRAISRSHTATHLLHQTLRSLLGEQAAQSGSENAPGRLRFDFTAPTAVSAGTLADVEDQVNAVLIEDLPVRAFLTSLAEARRLGALALFGEKYGDEVRVVEVGDYARELCGGTHANRSGQLGLVKLLRESSIGAGVRRIEGLVGLDAFRYLAREHLLVDQLSELLTADRGALVERVSGLVARVRDLERDLQRLRAGALLESAPEIAATAVDEGGVAVVTARAPADTGTDELRQLALAVRDRMPAARPAVVAIAAEAGGRASIVVALTEPARAAGLSARTLVGAAARALGGRGGGRDDIAQGGGGDPAAVDSAFGQVRQLVAERR